MRKIFGSLILFSFISSFAFAQKPEEALERWVSKSPIEKIYLHTDREQYAAGEVCWYKAYLSSDYLPDTISTSVYVELFNPSGTMILRKVTPVLVGTSNGQLELPDSLSTGQYTVRAFTRTMANHSQGFIFQAPILVFGKKVNKAMAVAGGRNRMEFFPEGGSAVNGFHQAIAFKVTNESGYPIRSSGKIFDESNREVTAFNTEHDGMGLFEIDWKGGEKYFATLEADPSQRYYLPEPVNKGIILTVIPHPQGSYFEIQQSIQDPVYQASYMIGQMQHHIVFRQDFKKAAASLQGVLNTKNLHSGILQITVFNKDGLPLAERICFVNNGEYNLKTEVVFDTLSFLPKGKNHFKLSMKDTVSGSFSVAIVDGGYTPGIRKRNILSSLLLTSDLKGYVHEPAYYFSSNNENVAAHLDLLMMTNGWRRFNWKQLMAEPVASNFKDAAYITLAGKASLRDSRKTFSNRAMLVMILHADSTRTIQMVNTDGNGEFKLDSLVFYGPSRIIFSDIRGKKNEYIDVKLSTDSVNRSFILPEQASSNILADTSTALANRMAEILQAIAKAEGLTLQGVTIKTKKKTPLQELEEKYASGMFQGMSERTIDLVNTSEVVTQANIFDYLQSRVPGLTVTNDELDYSIYYRQGGTISSMGLIPMVIYLDEIETDVNVVASIPGNQIAMVKVFSSFVGATGNGAGGVLAIYTKKDADVNAAISSADIVRYNGYSVIREFYAPDYTVNPAARSNSDQRVTLDWRPSVFVNNINPVIPFTFYNNDNSKDFFVVIEGMTSDGKLLMIEKKIR